MLTRRHRRTVALQAAWMLAALNLLLALDQLSPTAYYSASLFGFLVVVEATSPVHDSPPGRKPLYWVAAAGLLGFAAVTGYNLARLL